MKRALILALVTVFLLSFVLAGCGAKTPVTPKPTEPTSTTEEATKAPDADANKPMVLKESPFLKGKGLPPVAERMPKEPKLTNEMPADELNYKIGKYGGTLRSLRMEPIWDGTVWCAATEPLLNSPGRLGNEITPNVVKDYEVSADEKEFTFVLRDGMKWSDGQPLTTDDVVFAVNDVLMNKELTPIFPAWLSAAGKQGATPMVLEVVDKMTFIIKFDQPYAGFPLQLTTGDYPELIKPNHYLKQFHKKYADAKELEKKITDASFKTFEWYKLFSKHNLTGWDLGRPEMIALPVLYPYRHVKDGDVRIFDRNPYYFKIDSEGNQLPYIDRLQSTLVSDLEIATLKFIAGEVDDSYEWASITKLALYKENEAKAGIRILTKTKLHRTDADIFLNQTYKDTNWQNVVQDIRFRKALNLALDKKEIVDTVYFGYAKPAKMQGTVFNIDAANKLLDEMGMKKGTDGFRIGPDGKKFTIEFTYTDWTVPLQPTAQLVTEQWKLLGLDIQLKKVDLALWRTRVDANELQVTTLWSHGPVFAPWNDWDTNLWGQQWDAFYRTGGKSGIAPPPDVLNFYKMIESLRSVPLEEAKKVKDQIQADMAKNLWYLIPAEDVILPVVINAKLRNYDDAGMGIANGFGAEQWWFDN